MPYLRGRTVCNHFFKEGSKEEAGRQVELLLKNSWEVSVGCFRDVGNDLAKKREESGTALVRQEREIFTRGKMDCLSESLKIICLMGQCRRAQRQNAQTPATEHCQLSVTFPLSSTFLTQPPLPPSLLSVIFVEVSLERLVLT